MLLSLVACGNKSTAQEGSATKETKDTLKIAITADIPSLDPYSQNTDISNSFTLLFYDRLLDVDINTGELIPSLAESYEVVSAKEYVFHLRQGVKFHEGQELKASDVKFSLERVAESTGMSAKVAQIDPVEVVDDYTVRIVLNTASTTILNNLAFAGTSILSEEWCKAHQDSYVINGTGAYKFVEWNPGESVLLERNEEYWGEGGKMQYLKFVVMPEANARTIALENGEIDDSFSDFNLLASDRRVEYLLEKSEFYGYSGNRRKALVFCSRKKEAELLSKEFNKRGYKSVVLSGDDSQDKRLDAIDRLTNDENPDKLEFIFTVDIFNEGVDIPEINQVLLVRPTESPIIFIQQLGRGLRKYKNKEYVVIIDFIGNYKNNFMIPIALSGDRSYDKDKIRKYLMEGNKIIPGASSINFDEISQKRIYESINNSSFSKINIFKEKYNNLKYKLGRIPSLYDFAINAEFNPEIILNHSKFDTYHNFVEYVDKDYKSILSADEICSLKFIAKKLIKAIRPHELVILSCLKYNGYFTVSQVEKYLKEKYGLENQFDSIKNAINYLSMNFYRKETSDDYQANTVTSFVSKQEIDYENLFFKFDKAIYNDLKDNCDYKFTISDYFKGCLSNNVYLAHFEDAIRYAFFKYSTVYQDKNPFKLYEKYSREDVLRLLNWERFMNAQNVGGYKVKYNTCPIFVTYNKKEDISQTINYEDQFISKQLFSWMSRNNRKVSSSELEPIVNYIDLDIKLFIQKNNDEGIEFYYIGSVTPLSHEQLYREIDGKKQPIVNFKFKIDSEVKDELYSYFVNVDL